MSEPRKRRTVEDTLREGGPWFGLASDREMQRMIGGHGGSDRGGHLSLRHRWDQTWIEVETDTSPPRPATEEEGRALSSWFTLAIASAQFEPGNFPLTVEIHRKVTRVNVNGELVEFVMFGNGQNWMGFGRVAERTVRLDVRGAVLSDLDLVSIDPEVKYFSPYKND
jgi:hypothetical protein